MVRRLTSSPPKASNGNPPASRSPAPVALFFRKSLLFCIAYPAFDFWEKRLSGFVKRSDVIHHSVPQKNAGVAPPKRTQKIAIVATAGDVIGDGYLVDACTIYLLDRKS